MGIKVNLEDGMVEIGGNFQGALAFVKRQKGREYDPATKTWTVPQTIKDFVGWNRAGLPIDIMSGDNSNRYGDGNHVTRYGNVYSRDEWDAQKEAWKAEGEIAAKYAPENAQNDRLFAEALREVGVSEKGIRMIRAYIWDLEEVEGYRIKFSSPERRKQIYAIVEAYRKRQEEIWESQEAEEEARTIEIYERGGIL